METASKIDLLKQKCKVLTEVYDETAFVNLADEDSEIAVDNYVKMVENRGQLITRLEEIDQKLKYFNSNEHCAEEDEQRKKIVELIKKIVSADEKLKECVNALLSDIKDNLAQIKKSKDMKKIYEYDLYLSDSMGKGFDSSN